MHDEDWEKYNHEVEKYGFLKVSDIEKETGANRYKKYDNYYISELENELEAREDMVKFLVFFCFFITSLTSVFVGINGINLAIAGYRVTNDVVSKPDTIQVSAEVPSFIGYKKVYSDVYHTNILVYGNFEKGFRFINAQTNNQLYIYTSKPGEGIIVELPNVSKIILEPNY